MKIHYYGKLARGNLSKNARFYLPYVLTEAGLLACFYIILTLAMDNRMHEVKGGSYIPTFMLLGVIVMTILSTILMLYMNSFLMKQRKHEFGLYNILGMEKKHVCRILKMESFFSNAAAIVLGLVTGIVFYKLASLLICRLLNVKSVLGLYYIRPISIIPTLLFFIFLDTVIYFFNSIRIRRMKPVELLESKKSGEKEPKTNWFLFIPGAITLGIGYYQALSCKNPLQAINSFFSAVLLVIVGTYFLMTAGSILVLRLLKANKKYYYNRKHMIGVSGLLYRMRQNAVGLASITILTCGVLVMISTTISLYAGTEDALRKHFHSQLFLNARYENTDHEYVDVPYDVLKEHVEKAGAAYGTHLTDIHEETYLEVSYLQDGNRFLLTTPTLDINAANNLAVLVGVSEDEYTKMTGETLGLAENEAAVCSYQMNKPFLDPEIEIGGTVYKTAKVLDYFPISSSYSSIVNCYGVVLPGKDALQSMYDDQKAVYDVPSEYVHWYAMSFEEGKISYDDGYTMMDGLKKGLRAYCEAQEDYSSSFHLRYDDLWESAYDLYGMYGTLFFLGLILGFVFLFATTLIIYYKQISEGYEDREHFQILARIGLSDEEAKSAVSGQILLVFFLPMIVSAVHLLAAFPLLSKLLSILQLGNTPLFLKCTLLAYAGFAIIYTVIYRMTAKVYYRIVA